MGTYLNSGNSGFRTIRNGIYVDKTGLIDFINSTLNTADKLTCVSRPRRFGKSFAAKMLCAYYDKSCDSRALFEGLQISHMDSFEKNLNRYDVIYLDITGFLARMKYSGKNLVADLQNSVIQELREAFPGCVSDTEDYLADAMLAVTKKTGNQFFLIIDEWDALFREAKDDISLQEQYIWLLRSLYKNAQITDTILAGAYMTGILPVKKYGTQSALTDCREYTMTDPLMLTEYVGFTETEVRALCEQYQVDFSEMKRWYDGYEFSDLISVYNPNSVISAIKYRRFKTYWAESESYEPLKDYISMNKDGLKDAVIDMLGGNRVKIATRRFQNDMTILKSKDDVLTLLVHLGYLAYDVTTKEAYIPNQEIADEFQNAVEGESWQDVQDSLIDSEKLLRATIKGDTKAVAEGLRRVHALNTSVLQYNDENSLSCALTIAYFTAKRDYTIIRELPSGEGFADLAFIPRSGSDKPAMIIELKYDKSADGALRQIEEKRYNGVLAHYTGNLLLVGINYDKKTKEHECEIKRYKGAR
ncbi:MAG: ATP-binding protein [Clostridiales bacterium]|nr:ATP-binding protein [Clostridiales bacterium]